MPEATPVTPTPTPAAPPAPVAAPVTPPAPPAAAKSAETPPAAPADPKISSAFAALAKKDRDLQSEKARWKAQKEAEATAHAADIASAKKLAALREAAKTDPRKYKDIAEEFGLDYDKWTQLRLNDDEVPPNLEVDALRQEIADLKAGLNKTAEEKEAEAKKAAASQANTELVEARSAAVETVYAMPPEKIELVKAMKLGPYIVGMVEEHYNATQEWIAPEAVAEKVEETLRAGGELPNLPFAETWKQITETKWFQSKYQPVAAAPAAPAPKAAPVQTTRVVSEKPAVMPTRPSASPTITNSLTTSSSYPSIDRTKGASYREKIRAQALAKAFSNGATS